MKHNRADSSAIKGEPNQIAILVLGTNLPDITMSNRVSQIS